MVTDKEYVCLGAGIKSKPNLPAFTTINQAHLRGIVSVNQDGNVKEIPQGRNKLEHVKWVYHDKVGYILPIPSTVYLSNTSQEGRWSDISATKNASPETVSQEVFLLGIDHGNSPRDASYQYIVVPVVSAEELASGGVGNREIEILSNTPQLQGVFHKGLIICQLAFYQAGEVTISEGFSVKMDSQGMAMFKMNGNTISTLSVSDPSRKLTRITLTILGSYNKQGENLITLPDQNGKHTIIMVDLPTGVHAGSSTTIEL